MKNHWPLILGVGVPALFLLGVLGVAFLPRLGVGPSHDILLTSGYDYDVDYIDKIENGKLVRYPNEDRLKDYRYENGIRYDTRREPNPAKAPKIYRYSFTDESLKEISFDDASKLSLDAGPTSDDGFSVGAGGYSHDGIFEIFGSNGNRSGQLPIYRDGKEVDKITLPANSNYYYYGSIKFLAWIN